MRNVFIICALELNIPFTYCKYSIKRIYKMTVNKLGFEIVFYVDRHAKLQNIRISILNTNESLLFTYTV